MTNEKGKIIGEEEEKEEEEEEEEWRREGKRQTLHAPRPFTHMHTHILITDGLGRTDCGERPKKRLERASIEGSSEGARRGLE